MHVVRFPEALADAIADLLPNRLTEYLYELTDIFNSFYVECQVRGAINIQRLTMMQDPSPFMRGLVPSTMLCSGIWS